VKGVPGEFPLQKIAEELDVRSSLSTHHMAAGRSDAENSSFPMTAGAGDSDISSKRIRSSSLTTHIVIARGAPFPTRNGNAPLRTNSKKRGETKRAKKEIRAGGCAL